MDPKAEAEMEREIMRAAAREETAFPGKNPQTLPVPRFLAGLEASNRLQPAVYSEKQRWKNETSS